MSTKTTLKRIALVAVSALGFGVMTAIAPASAAVTAVTAGTPSPARVGALSTTTITATKLADDNTFIVAARVTAAPATSTLLTDTHTATASAGKGVFFTQSATGGAVSNPSQVAGGASATVAEQSADATSSPVTLGFRADVAGTYTILVSAGATSFTAGNPSTVVTITTAGAPTTITLASVAGAVVEGGTRGQLFSMSLKDANGNATVLGESEGISLSESDSTMLLVNRDGVADTSAGATNAVLGIGVDSPNLVAGVYYFRAVAGAAAITDGAAVITASGNGLLSPTLTANISATEIGTSVRAEALPTGTNTFALTSTTGYVASCTGAGSGSLSPSFCTKRSSHGFTLTFTNAFTTGSPAAEAASTWLVAVVPPLGSNFAYDTSVSVASGAKTGTVTVSQALALTDSALLSVTGPVSNTPITFATKASAATTNAIQGGSSILSATGGSNKFTVLVRDQYAAAMPFVGVNVTITGRNALASTPIGVTDANGLISYTLTDKGTTGTTDSVAFSVSGIATPASATITYGTVTVGTVAVTGGSTVADAGVEGANLTAISAAGAGPHGNAKDITATVKDANGNLLAGVPVTFTVSKGLIQKTAAIDYTTVYTNSDGTAVTKVIDWTPGKQTITATAGGVSGTDYLTWAASDATSARVVSATVTGNAVSVKVVDRYGNPVTGVNVDLSREGTGFFGNGTSTATVKTDKFGTADIQFNGNAKVTAALDTAVYVQSADKAGEVAATAVTAAVAGTTVGTGASLAPAGVNKVTVTVAEGTDPSTVAANAAADAAAEAIDAANAATDAANLAAEAADAATVAAEEARDAADAATAAVEELATQVATLMAALKAQITTLANTVAKIARKVRA